MKTTPLLNLYLLESIKHKYYFRIMKISTVLLFLSASQLFAVDGKAHNTGAAIELNEKSFDVSKEISKLSINQIDITVKGTVLDNTGLPIIGANILIEGTTTGTVTDFDGNFELTAPANASIVVSYIGYNKQIVPLKGQKKLRIVIIEDTQALDEVVVVGYATVKKANLTGAVSSVDSKVLEDRPITNLGQGLQGSVSNLNVTTSGRPGEGASFNIRGNMSLSGGSPLILVDGVEMDPNLINPQDVKSVSVLKDAASAAIYGSRAAYGVMLITTKSGKKNQDLKITFDASVSFNSPTSRPKYMESVDYATYMNAASQMTNGRDYFDAEYMGKIKDYYNNPSANSTVFVHSDPNISKGGTRYSYCGNTDWMDAIYKKNYPIQKYNIGINGGTEKVTYYTSAGYLDQGSLIRYGDESYKKFNIMNNVSYDIKKWFNVSLKTTFNRTELTGVAQTRAHGSTFIGGDTSPLMPVKHPDGNWSGQGNTTNFPAVIEDAGNRGTQINDFWNTISARVNPIEGLNVNFDYTFNTYGEANKFQTKSLPEYGVDGQFLQLFPWTKTTGVYESQKNDTYNAVNFFVDYEKNLGKNYLKGLVGYNQDTKHFRSLSAERQGLIVDNVPSMGNAIGEKYVNNNDNSWAIRGAFFRLNYGYDERYLLEVNGRYDLSSRFPSKDRTVFNPSASAAWRISNEAFFSEAKDIVDELKVRASYGSLGNQSVDALQPYLSNMGTGTLPWIMGSVQNQYVTAGGLVSPFLTWETATQWDLGLDFSMLDSRLKGTFDYYERTTSNILMQGKELPSIIGTSEPLENAAAVRTAGWELEMSWNDSFDNGMSYSVGFNISDYQAEVTQFDNPTGTFSQNYVGKKLGEIWGYETVGLFQTEEQINQSADHTKISGIETKPGDLMFADRDGDGEINWGDNTLANPGDQYIIGNTTPRYQYGIKGSLDWKNFDLNVFFQGVGKRDVNLPQAMFLSHYGNEWSVPSAINTDYWTVDNTDAFFPGPRFNGGGTVGKSQTRFLQDASYCRLKSLVFGYTVPTNVLSKLGIDKLRIYFSGENLFTISSVPEGFDPEVLDAQKYPLQKSYSLGLSLTL